MEQHVQEVHGDHGGQEEWCSQEFKYSMYRSKQKMVQHQCKIMQMQVNIRAQLYHIQNSEHTWHKQQHEKYKPAWMNDADNLSRAHHSPHRKMDANKCEHVFFKRSCIWDYINAKFPEIVY